MSVNQGGAAKKTHYSAAELAGMKLPGLPTTKRGIELASSRANWTFQEVKGRGGRTGTRKEYAVSALPAESRQALMERHITVPIVSSAATSPAALPAASSSPTLAGLLLPSKVQAAGDLTDKQRAERDARKAVLAAIERLQATAGCGREPAMTTLLTTARTGRLDPALDAMLRQARDPRGRAGDGYPSVRTLKRWLAAPDLAPKVARKEMTVPPWAKSLLKLYQQPQKPSLAACMEELQVQLPPGIEMPSYHAARRFLDKLGAIERQRGRMLPRELKNLQPFVRRDASGMTPDAIYTADGHTFDAEIAHPRHGRPFRPEITTVVSVPTRRCVGWSAGLAESTWAVMDALRNAVETAGVPMIWYVDNGCGYKNAAMTDEVTGFLGRLGTTATNSLPYNSQARGVEERSHQSIWVRGAKKLATYMGADMDRQAKQKVFKLTRADIRNTGTSRHLLPWDSFLDFCQAEIDAYNARPHSSLPKTRDPQTGKPRHMSPNEAWQAAIAEGWQPEMLAAGEINDLFRPEQICTTTRGEIRINNHLYFSRDLAEFTGEKVRVGYDIHDASRVWVRDMEGRLITVAEFEANKRAYFAENVIEQAARKRAETRLARLEAHAQEVREELDAPALLEHQPVITVPMPVPPAAVEIAGEYCSTENIVALPGIEARPIFRNDPDMYRWLMRNPAQWDEQDAGWLLDYVAGDDYQDLRERYEFQGVAWSNDDAQRAQDKLNSEVAAR